MARMKKVIRSKTFELSRIFITLNLNYLPTKLVVLKCHRVMSKAFKQPITPATQTMMAGTKTIAVVEAETETKIICKIS